QLAVPPHVLLAGGPLLPRRQRAGDVPAGPVRAVLPQPERATRFLRAQPGSATVGAPKGPTGRRSAALQSAGAGGLRERRSLSEPRRRARPRGAVSQRRARAGPRCPTLRAVGRAGEGGGRDRAIMAG